jgi:hypothetical protein
MIELPGSFLDDPAESQEATVGQLDLNQALDEAVRRSSR